MQCIAYWLSNTPSCNDLFAQSEEEYCDCDRDAKKLQGPGEPQLPKESELGFIPPAQPQYDAPEDSNSASLQQWELVGDDVTKEESPSEGPRLKEVEVNEVADPTHESVQGEAHSAPAQPEHAPQPPSSPGTCQSASCS